MKGLKISKTALLVSLIVGVTGLQVNWRPGHKSASTNFKAELEAAPPGDLRTAVMETCGGCHANQSFTTAGGYSLLTGASAHAGGVFAQSQGVDPTAMVSNDPLTALIVQKPLEGSSMPHGGIKIPEDHPALQEIINWIRNGAPVGALNRPAQPPVDYALPHNNDEHHIIYVRTDSADFRPGGFQSIIGSMGSNPNGDIWRAKFRFDSGLDRNVVSENVNITNLPDTYGVADPSLSPDGTKIVFAGFRPGQPWQIFEINVNGSGLRQITSGPNNKAQPVYLPYNPDGTPARSGEGGILYTSDEPGFRDEYNTGRTTNLFVCDSNGGNKRQIGFTPSHELHPTLHSNGAMIFTRWEHNEHQGHNFMPLFAILTSDYQTAGTNLFAAYGEHHIAPIPMANSLHSAKEVLAPGFNGKMIAIASSRDATGGSLVGPFYPIMTGDAGANRPVNNVIDIGQNDEGMRDGETNPNPIDHSWRRPNALLNGTLIASRTDIRGVDENINPFNGQITYTYIYENYRIVTVHTSGAVDDIKLDKFYELPLGPVDQHHFDSVMPLVSVPTPDKIGKPVDMTKNTGIFTSGNITQRQSDGQPSNFTTDDVGVVRFLQATGSRADVDTGRQRDEGIATQIIGEVPVASDGSFAAEVTAEASIQFQVINRGGQSLVHHKPWVQVMKGETMRCVGCHAGHSDPPTIQTLEARQGPAMALGVEGLAQFDYERDIQPIWDAKCVSCHDSARVHGAEAGLSLAGRKTPGNRNESFDNLLGPRMRGNGMRALVQTQGSMDSLLIDVLTNTDVSTGRPLDPPMSVPHEDMLTPEELEMITKWIDTGTNYRVSGNPADPLRSLDMNAFRNQVWPHLAALCESCHTAGGAGAMAMNLDGNPAEAESEDDLFEDRMAQVAFRSNFMIPEASEILRKPLGQTLGGLSHGGGQVLTGLQDPAYLALYNWIASVNPKLAPGGPSTDLVNVKNYPNPFRDVTTIVYGLVGTVISSVEINIYSQTGKLIRELPATSNSGGMTVGWNRVEWDGKDKNGKEVGNDVYFYTVEAKFGDGTTKIIKGKCVKVK